MTEITSVEQAMQIIDQLRERYGVTIDELVTDEYSERSKRLRRAIAYLVRHADDDPEAIGRQIDEWHARGVYKKG